MHSLVNVSDSSPQRTTWWLLAIKFDELQDEPLVQTLSNGLSASSLVVFSTAVSATRAFVFTLPWQRTQTNLRKCRCEYE